MIALYDDNHITIDGDTSVSFTEDVLKRYEAYGWHTIHVKDGNTDLAAIAKAIEEAKSVTDRPSMIKVTTTIGYGSPNKSDTAGVHGAALGAEELLLHVRTWIGTTANSKVPRESYDQWRQAVERGSVAEASGTPLWPTIAASTQLRLPNLSVNCAVSCHKVGTRISRHTARRTRVLPPVCTPTTASTPSVPTFRN